MHCIIYKIIVLCIPMYRLVLSIAMILLCAPARAATAVPSEQTNLCSDLLSDEIVPTVKWTNYRDSERSSDPQNWEFDLNQPFSDEQKIRLGQAWKVETQLVESVYEMAGINLPEPLASNLKAVVAATIHNPNKREDYQFPSIQGTDAKYINSIARSLLEIQDLLRYRLNSKSLSPAQRELLLNMFFLYPQMDTRSRLLELIPKFLVKPDSEIAAFNRGLTEVLRLTAKGCDTCKVSKYVQWTSVAYSHTYSLRDSNIYYRRYIRENRLKEDFTPLGPKDMTFVIYGTFGYPGNPRHLKENVYELKNDPFHKYIHTDPGLVQEEGSKYRDPKRKAIYSRLEVFEGEARYGDERRLSVDVDKAQETFGDELRAIEDFWANQYLARGVMSESEVAKAKSDDQQLMKLYPHRIYWGVHYDGAGNILQVARVVDGSDYNEAVHLNVRDPHRPWWRRPKPFALPLEVYGSLKHEVERIEIGRLANDSARVRNGVRAAAGSMAYILQYLHGWTRVAERRYEEGLDTNVNDLQVVFHENMRQAYEEIGFQNIRRFSQDGKILIADFIPVEFIDQAGRRHDYFPVFPSWK